MSCFIPTCTNNKHTTPPKIFVKLRDTMKKEWCLKVGAKYQRRLSMFICEDHLVLQEDLENYFKWKLLNEAPILKANATVRYQNTSEKENIENESNTSLMLKEAPNLSKLLLTSTKRDKLPLKRRHEEYSTMPSTSATTLPILVDSSTQCSVKMVDKQTNYKARRILLPTQSFSFSEPSEISSEDMRSSPSLFGSTETGTTGTETMVDVKVCNIREQMLGLINKKPKLYLGIPLQYLWIIDYILLKSPIKATALCLILALFKLKQNDTNERMSDHFEMSPSKVSTMITLGIEVLVNFLQNLIYLPTKMEIKKNLPMVFKIKYSSVQMIIDCFEIQIEKPTDPVKQAQSWSQYKNCNTVKYLVGSTPNGFISFVSEGYGGRISDKALVEKSNLIDILPPNAVLMADRGFKEIEALLSLKSIKMLRPPSVFSGVKPTKEQVLLTKTIASLRIHIERVIRRIREFRLLKPHSVVNHSLVNYLDEMVVIACGLVNLQGEIIKKR